MRFSFLAVILVVVSYVNVYSQDVTMGLLKNDSSAFVGYTLFAPIPSTTTYLIDNCGRKVHSWPSRHSPAFSTHLLDNGDLFRLLRLQTSPIHSGVGGAVEQVSWEGLRTWYYEISDSNQLVHHDAIKLPNGNALLIVAYRIPLLTVRAAGRDSARLFADMWVDKIIEVQPIGENSGNVVWEWNAWDHIVQDRDQAKPNYGVIADHPGKIDVNYHTDAQGVPYRDWTHINSVDYDPALDRILVSVRNFDEVWIIDHSTTTEQAKGAVGGRSGKGGELLYRWGNPNAYKRGQSTSRFLFSQHGARWTASSTHSHSNIIVFDNGTNRPAPRYSSVIEIETPLQQDGSFPLESGTSYKPSEPTWVYTSTLNTDFYSSVFGGVQRLANGNTLISSGSEGEMFEVDYSGKLNWKYVSPINTSGVQSQGDTIRGNTFYSAFRYDPSHPAFLGRTLTPGEEIETEPIKHDCFVDFTTGVREQPIQSNERLLAWPNPFSDVVEVNAALDATDYYIYDSSAQLQMSGSITASTEYIDTSSLPAGMYLLRLSNGSKMLIVKH